MGVLLRSEGVLWTAAVGAVLIVAAPTFRQRFAGVCISIVGAVALFGEREWRDSILGSATPSLGVEDRAPGSTVVDRVAGIRTAALTRPSPRVWPWCSGPWCSS